MSGGGRGGHPTDDPEAVYRDRRDRFREAAEEEAARSARLTRIRGLLFVLGIALPTAAEVLEGGWTTVLAATGLLSLVAFAASVRRHRRVRAEEGRLRGLAELNETALARLRREWSALPDVPTGDVDPDHPYGGDLSIAGERSLLGLFTDVATRPGRDALRRWLLEPGDASRVPERQQAVAELATRLDFRQGLAVRGRSSGADDSEPVDRLVAWGEEESPWRPPGWLVAASWILPPISVGLLVAHLGGLTGAPWWLGSMAAAWAAVSYRGRELSARMERIGSGAERLGRYGDLLELVSEMEAEAPLLRRIREAARSGEASAPEELRRLRSRVAWSEVRHNDLMHFPLQALLLWDVHAVRALEGWRRRCGGRIRTWLRALGRLEALSALAMLRADHPDWCFPRLDPDAAGMTAEALGHPLLADDRTVRNDVELGPPGTFLFVTGSNMAGKSTLLRALGTNTVLARAGAPVCASALRLPPLRVHTAMRVRESLSEGISYFMAELRRIRGVVEAARRGDREGREPVLYLLDEPLQGTNEAERRVAVRIIVRHLIATSALGAVATHDLRLHDTDLLDRAADPVHLEGTVREEDGGPVLSFDYRLRPGLATSSNALALLRAVGLGDGGGPAELGGRETDEGPGSGAPG